MTKHWSTRGDATACGATQVECYYPEQVDCIPCLKDRAPIWDSAKSRLAELEAAKPQRTWYADAWREQNACIICGRDRGRFRYAHRNCWDALGREEHHGARNAAESRIRSDYQSPSPQPSKPMANVPAGAIHAAPMGSLLGKALASTDAYAPKKPDPRDSHILALVAVIRDMPSSAFDRLSLAKSQRVIKEALECVVPRDKGRK